MKKIAIIGAPSTGKSSLARGVVAELSQRGFISEYVAEYAARYIKKYGVPKELWEQVRIFQKQKDWEDLVPHKVQFLVTDSPLILGIVYGRYAFQPSSPKSQMLYGDLMKMTLKSVDRYDHIFYLDPVLDPVDDGTRTQLTKQSQMLVDQDINHMLDMFNLSDKVTRINCAPWQERLGIVLSELLPGMDMDWIHKSVVGGLRT